MKYFPLAILLATALDVLQMLYRSFDIDYWQGMELPNRWIAWGTCRGGLPHRPNPQYDFRYFVLRLPSYQWVCDYCYDRQAWGQLTLLRFAGKWRANYWVRT